MIAVAFETVFWWALMVGVWQLTLSGTTPAEIYCEVATAFLSAVAAVVARHALGGRWLPKPTWVGWLPVLALSVIADSARVLALAVRHVGDREAPGHFDVVQLRWPDLVEADTHRAYATLTVTSTPGSLVYHDEPESHRLCLHALVSGPPDLRQVVAD
jgi:multisubunit Na+/H+ antiporter MnhE subunit